MYEHLTPNKKIISYPKLLYFVQHQINIFNQDIQNIEDDALYYVFNKPESIKQLSNLHTGLEQWEFLKEILEEQPHILEL